MRSGDGAPPSSGPIQRALAVIGCGVPLALVIGVVYGLLIGDVARGVGVAGAITMIVVAGVAVIAATGAGRDRSTRN